MNTPSSIDAEEALIGAILCNDSQIYDVLEIVKPNDFYEYKYGKVFEAITQIADSPTRKIDMVTVKEQLEKMKTLESEQIETLLSFFMTQVPTISSVIEYAKIIKEKSNLRKIIEHGRNLITYASNETLLSEEIASIPLELGDQADETVSLENTTQFKEALVQRLANIEDKVYDGVMSGIKPIDDCTSLWRFGELTAIAGEDEIGKTSWALIVSYNISIQVPVLFFSLDEPVDGVIEKFASIKSRFSKAQLMTGRYGAEDIEDIAESVKSRIYIPRCSNHILDIERIIKKEVRKKGIKVVVIDYITTIVSGNRFGKTQETQEIVNRLKTLARTLGIHIIMLSQLKRDEDRERRNIEPIKADIMWASEVHNACRNVILIWRDRFEDSTLSDITKCKVVKASHTGLHGKFALKIQNGNFAQVDFEEAERKRFI